MHDGLIDRISNPVSFPILADYGQSGIYFLHYRNDVVYVGQAANMRVRIAGHLAEGRKTFDAVSCLPCDEGHLNATERLFICWFVPSYNRCGLSQQLRLMKQAGCSSEDMMRLADGDGCRLAPDTAAAMLGIDQSRLLSISERQLPFTIARVGTARARSRRYRMADVMHYRLDEA